jgi:hypothetical protein
MAIGNRLSFHHLTCALLLSREWNKSSVIFGLFRDNPDAVLEKSVGLDSYVFQVGGGFGTCGR